jgi:hypothetical protein
MAGVFPTALDTDNGLRYLKAKAERRTGSNA